MTQPPGGFSLGNATGHVDIDPSGVRTGLQEARGQLNSFGQSMGQFVSNTGRQVRQFGLMWTAVAAPLGAALGAGINAAASFDETLIEIQARTGLTADAMDQVRQTALQLGADTVFSTQQAADAFLQLLTAGLDYEQALETLPNVLDGAAAGGIELGRSADIVTNVMSAFNLEASETAEIVEALSRGAASSPATMLELGEAMQRAGGMASSLGIDVDQTSAILSIFAQNGLRGSEAGTQLNSMLRNMARQTPDVQAAWSELGVSLFDAQGNLRNLDTVFQEIEASMANMPIEDQNRLITTLAGSYGMLGFNAILSSDGIASMEETMAGQSSAAEVAAARMESFRGQLNSLMGSVQALMITALTPFMNNVLRPIISLLINATNGIRAWAEENEGLTQAIITFLAILVGLGPVLTVVGQAMIFIGGALGFWLSPIGLVVTALGGLAFMLRDRLPNAMGVVSGFIEGIRVLFLHFKEDLETLGIGEAILGIFGRASEGQGSAESTLEGLFFRMGFSREAAINLTNTIFEVFSTWFIRIRQFFNRVGNAVAPMFREIGEFFSNNAGGIARFAQQLFNIFLTLVRFASPLRLLTHLLSFFGVDLMRIFEIVANRIALFFALINEGIPVVNALRAVFNNARWFNVLLSGFQTVAAFITGTVIPALVRVRDFFIGLFDAFQEGGFEGAGTFIQDNLVTPLLNSIQNIDWRQVASRLMNAIGVALETGIAWATWVMNNILMPMFNSVSTAIGNVDWGQVATTILNAIGTGLLLWADWVNFVTDNILTPIFDFLKSQAENIDWEQLGRDIVAFIFSPFTGGGDDGMDWGAVFNAWMGALGNFASTVFDFQVWVITNVLSPLISGMLQGIADVDWSTVGKHILHAIGSAITTAVKFLVWVRDNILEPIVENAATAITNVNWSSVGRGIVNAIGAAITATFDFIGWIIRSIFSPIDENARSATDQTGWSGVGEAIMNGIGNFFTGIFDFIFWFTINVLAPLIGGAVSAIGSYDWSGVGDGMMDAIADSLPNMITWATNNIIRPIRDALVGFNPMAEVNQDIGRGGAITPANLGNFANPFNPLQLGLRAGRAIGNLVGFDVGTPFVPNDMVAKLHAGEMVVPAEFNPNNPNARQPLNLGGAGDTYHIPITVSPPPGMTTAQATRLGESLGDGIMRKLRANGK